MIYPSYILIQSKGIGYVLYADEDTTIDVLGVNVAESIKTLCQYFNGNIALAKQFFTNIIHSRDISIGSTKSQSIRRMQGVKICYAHPRGYLPEPFNHNAYPWFVELRRSAVVPSESQFDLFKHTDHVKSNETNVVNDSDSDEDDRFYDRCMEGSAIELNHFPIDWDSFDTDRLLLQCECIAIDPTLYQPPLIEDHGDDPSFITDIQSDTFLSFMQYIWTIDIDRGIVALQVAPNIKSFKISSRPPLDAFWDSHICDSPVKVWPWKALYLQSVEDFQYDAEHYFDIIQNGSSDSAANIQNTVFYRAYSAIVIQTFVRGYLARSRAVKPPDGYLYCKAKMEFEDLQGNNKKDETQKTRKRQLE